MTTACRGTSIILLVSFVLVPDTLRAAELARVNFPDRIDCDGTSLVLNGVGLRQKTVFYVDVYVAALYVRSRSDDEKEILSSSEIKELDVVFLRDVSVDDLVRSWDEGFALNCKDRCERYASRLANLKSAMVAVKKGQKVQFIFSPVGVKLVTPEGNTQTFFGKDFADLVLANFIGVPPSKALKLGLLGR